MVRTYLILKNVAGRYGVMMSGCYCIQYIIYAGRVRMTGVLYKYGITSDSVMIIQDYDDAKSAISLTY